MLFFAFAPFFEGEAIFLTLFPKGFRQNGIEENVRL